jgi:hypothetical protein
MDDRESDIFCHRHASRQFISQLERELQALSTVFVLSEMADSESQW